MLSPWVFSVEMSEMRVLNKLGMRRTNLRQDLPFLGSQGSPGGESRQHEHEPEPE